jgi:hypothetical protein
MDERRSICGKTFSRLKDTGCKNRNHKVKSGCKIFSEKAGGEGLPAFSFQENWVILMYCPYIKNRGGEIGTFNFALQIESIQSKRLIQNQLGGDL